MKGLKKCNLTECECYQEGYCNIENIYPNLKPEQCNAKTDKDLITEEEFYELLEKQEAVR